MTDEQIKIEAQRLAIQQLTDALEKLRAVARRVCDRMLEEGEAPAAMVHELSDLAGKAAN